MTLVGERPADPGAELHFADSPEPDDTPAPPAGRRAWSWLAEQWSSRLWPTIVLFSVLASVATLTNAPGLYVGDNRFEQYWNPARRIAKTFAIWDGSRGLGRVREDFWPATTAPIALLRGLGFSPIWAEHLFHAMCIAMAGIGMVAVVRLFRPRIGLEHTLAGLAMAFGAFSATFLLPSNLYFHFALAPWLFVVTYKGLLSERPWRWAAVFALLVFAPGNVDTPGLVYNVVPLVPLCLYLVFVERSVRLRNVIGWFARAFVLTVLVNAVVIAKTMFAAAALGQRLNDTEAADIAALTSSWSESLRGLGNWLTYFPAQGSSGAGLLKPQGEAYLVNPVIIAFTFVPPCIALFALWRSRWRVRILYVLLMLSSLVILVGAFPRSNSSPLGRQILSAYTNIKLLTAFRNTYKIGAGLVIGVSALFAAGVMIGYRAVRRRWPTFRWVPVAGAFLTVSIVAFPFWTGNLYNATQTTDGVPAYWSQALTWLDGLPTQGRSLIVPQTSRTRYRWGWVGDDIFDALMTRPHAIATGVPLSTPTGGNAVEAMTLATADPEYTPGVLGPMARRLGITEIVVRNDVDWQDMGRPRPAAFDGVRTDPDFELAATFGGPGEYTTASTDVSETADRERELPPIEVYRLKDTTGILRVQQGNPPLLVSGDAFAWPGLARAGLLTDDAPIAYTGDADAARMAADLEAGSPLLVTDSNRRRLRVLLSYEPDYSYLLGDGQDLDRPAQSLFKDQGSQTTSWYPDADRMRVDGSPRSIGGTQLWNRPSYAFDGDPKTSWLIRRFDRPFEHVFHVDLREPTRVEGVTIRLPGTTTPGDGIKAGTLRFSDGTEQRIELTGRIESENTYGFSGRFDAPHDVTWIEFVPTEIGDLDQTVGIADLLFYRSWDGTGPAPGARATRVDLNEYTQLPDDVFRDAEVDPRLADLVARAPTGYLFDRSIRTTQQNPPPTALSGAQSTDEELSLRRRFEVLGAHTFQVGGYLRLRNDVDDRLVDELVGGDTGAYGPRHNGGLGGRGGNAVDGVGPRTTAAASDVKSTAWFAPIQPNVFLTVRFPAQELRSVQVDSANDGYSTRMDAIEVLVPDPDRPDDIDAATSIGTIDMRIEKDGVSVPLQPPADNASIEDEALSNLRNDCEGDRLDVVPGCLRSGTLLPPAEQGGVFRDAAGRPIVTDRVFLRVTKASADEQFLVGPRVRIDEAVINGRSNQSPDLDKVRDDCIDLGLQIGAEGGDPTSVPVRLEGSVADLLAGRTVPFSSCSDLRLTSGWHRLVTPPNAPFDQVQLLTPDLAATAGRRPDPGDTSIEILQQSSTQLKLRLDRVDERTTLLFDQSWDPGWRAFVGGVPLGSSRSLDAVNGWALDGAGSVDVELRYNPQRTFAYSLVITGAGLALCVYLIVRRPRRRKVPDG